jgi:hypothetical protein
VLATHDPHKIQLDDGAELHAGCVEALLRRVVLTMSLTAYSELAACLMRRLGAQRFARLSERVMQPRFQAAGAQTARDLPPSPPRTAADQAFVAEKRRALHAVVEDRGRKPIDPHDMLS